MNARSVDMMNGNENEEDGFSLLVAADIRNEASPEDSAHLRSTDTAQAWYDELINIISRIDAQLSRAKSERAQRVAEMAEWLAKQESWRSSALGFRRVVRERLSEARAILRETGEDDSSSVAKYREAIKAHRDTVANSAPEDDTADADEALWHILER